MLALEGHKHLPSHAPVAEVASRARTKLGDVLGFGKIHFKETSYPGGERKQIESGLRRFWCATRGDLRTGAMSLINCPPIVIQEIGFCQEVNVGLQVAIRWGVVPVQGSK